MSILFHWIFRFLAAAFVGEISSRIISCLIDHLWRGENTNREKTNRENTNRENTNRENTNRGHMLIARDLQIHCWPYEWVYPNESRIRFPEVLQIWSTPLLDIRATINLVRLSPKTNYAALFIFHIYDQSVGLDSLQEASVSVGINLQWKKVVCINPDQQKMSGNKCIGLPVKRSDGFTELELGQFYCDTGIGDVYISLRDTSLRYISFQDTKLWFIVAGIEVHPI